MTRLVILGATGDLAGRYLLPALAQLRTTKDATELDVIGVGQEDWDTERFRAHAQERLHRHGPAITEQASAGVVDRLTYVQADVTNPISLKRALDGDADTVVYLALPPGLFAPTIEALGRVGHEDLRVVIEKPFGTGLGSAQELNRLLHDRFPETSIFRMDHFLGKQTVQNLLGLRFANRVFEPLWCNAHVDAVDIVWDETIALEGRAGYYDRAGALRDMIQNHLLQLLALAAMERPRSLEATELRDAKVEVLRRIVRPDAEHVRNATIRARYTSGQIGERVIPNYVDEPGVDAERDTETYAEVTLFIENERWEGVPFRLRTGKALAVSRREIHVHFRYVDPLPFAPQHELLPNRLVLSMDPDRMSLDIALNGAGDPFRLEPARLDLDLAPQELSAYARLLLDALEGDPALSIRGDEAEESWRVVDPIVAGWRSGEVPLSTYVAGSDGPKGSAIAPADRDTIRGG